MKRRIRVAIRLIAIAAVTVALWFFVRELDVRDLGHALRSARVWPLVIAAGLNFACVWGKATVWRIILAPRHVVPTRRLFRYAVAAFGASAIAPARAGEVLRVWALKQRDGVPAADTAAVALSEKLLDGITMVILMAPLPWLLELPDWIETALVICAAVGIALFVGLYLAVGRVTVTDSSSVVRRLIGGMHVLRSGRRVAGAVAVLALVWLCDLTMVLSVAYALGVHFPIAGGLLILFTLNLAIAIPSTPAGVGALEVGAVAALDLLHVPREQAFAFALLYHALQVVPLVIAGLALEHRLVLGRPLERSAKTG